MLETPRLNIMYQPSDVYDSSTTWPQEEPQMEIKPKVVRVMEMKRTGPRPPAKPKIHTCPRCADGGKFMAFSRRPDLYRHISSVHEKKRPFMCRWQGCGKRFSQSASLETHKNTHTGEKPWLCGICAAPFGDQSSCARHQREQHTGLTHFCPYCSSTNKRASDFKNHLSANHDIKEGSIDMAQYKLPLQTTLELLRRLPQFNLPGMTGLEIRRKHPHRVRGAAVSHTKPTIKISDLEGGNELIAFPETYQASPCISYQATPSSATTCSLSPSPSFVGVGDDSYYAQPSPYVHGYTNALGMELGASGQRPYSDLHGLSRASSTASFLSDGRPPTISRTSSASSFTTECYTPEVSTVPEEAEQKPFAYTHDMGMTSSSPYMHDTGGQVYCRAQTARETYAHHDQATFDTAPREDLQSKQRYNQYLPGGLGISRTIRSRANLTAWNSQESFN